MGFSNHCKQVCEYDERREKKMEENKSWKVPYFLCQFIGGACIGAWIVSKIYEDDFDLRFSMGVSWLAGENISWVRFLSFIFRNQKELLIIGGISIIISLVLKYCNKKK